MSVFPALRKKIMFVIVVGIFIAISILLATYSSEEILSVIGVENAYLLMFILAALGGMSTFTGIPYHFILMSFAASGINPFFLGLITALGVMLGDSMTYFLGHQSSDILPKRFKKPLAKISTFLVRHPKFMYPFLITYGAVSPFSNDFIVISMGMIRYSYWKIMIPLTLGNIFFNIALAYLGYFAFNEVIGWF